MSSNDHVRFRALLARRRLSRLVIAARGSRRSAHHRRAACFRTTEHVIASKLLNPVSQDLDTGAAAAFSFRTDFEPGRPPIHIVGGLFHYAATQSSTLIFRGEVAGRKSRL